MNRFWSGLSIILTLAFPFSFAFGDITTEDTVTITAVVPSASTDTGSSGGGGGGGGGSSSGEAAASPSVTQDTPATNEDPEKKPTTSNVVFEGVAYAGSIVSILKNGVIVSEAPANIDGSFAITIKDVDPDTYVFAVRAQNSSGRISNLQTYTVLVSLGVTTTVKGISITEAPDTTDLIQDINNDAKVDLTDFSIMAFWYGKPESPKSVDLNKDGKVNLADFSILAYYWTG